MHLVHYSERYDSVDTASANAEGLAVLGVFFEVSTLAVKNGCNIFYSFEYRDKIWCDTVTI